MIINHDSSTVALDTTRSRHGQEEAWDEVSAGEALYDQPVLRPLFSTEDSHFHEPLFDDPGYNKGLGLTGQISLPVGGTEHTYNILEGTGREDGKEEREREDPNDDKNISEQTAATMTSIAQSLEVLRQLDEQLKDEAISSQLEQGHV